MTNLERKFFPMKSLWLYTQWNYFISWLILWLIVSLSQFQDICITDYTFSPTQLNAILLYSLTQVEFHLLPVYKSNDFTLVIKGPAFLPKSNFLAIFLNQTGTNVLTIATSFCRQCTTDVKLKSCLFVVFSHISAVHNNIVLLR